MNESENSSVQPGSGEKNVSSSSASAAVDNVVDFPEFSEERELEALYGALTREGKAAFDQKMKEFGKTLLKPLPPPSVAAQSKPGEPEPPQPEKVQPFNAADVFSPHHGVTQTPLASPPEDKE